MPRLVWGERNYEAGISRGVVYPIDAEGVPWNGLVSVTEGFVGGEKSSHYFDGVKFLELVAARNFQATVTAFDSPNEFRRFVGERNLLRGFRLCNQPKRRFNFSYRTETEAGYKLHLVYNALATPQTRVASSQAPGQGAAVSAWLIDATPMLVPNFRPASHFVVDSSRAPEDRVTQLEAILYGTEASPSEFPSLTTLFELFEEV